MIAVSSAKVATLASAGCGRSLVYSTHRSGRPLPDNTQHSQQTSMPTAEFEAAISASERPKTYALDRADTGPGVMNFTIRKYRGTS